MQQIELGIPRDSQEELERKLLSLGGKQICWQPNPHLDIILSRGRIFSLKGRRHLRLAAHQCHSIATAYHMLSEAKLKIAIGYQLSRDIWKKHAWIMDGDRIIEPNLSPQMYFGTLLTQEESLELVIYFAFSLPGAREFLQKQLDNLPKEPAVASEFDSKPCKKCGAEDGEDDFDKTYHRLSLSGKCDTSGGCEWERVKTEWVSAGKPPDIEQFITSAANLECPHGCETNG